MRTKELDFPELIKNAAGIDIGSKNIFVGIPHQPVKIYETYTESYLECLSYLKHQKIESVVMESTGVYWIPLYNILESGGIKICLVNGRDTKNLPGRKSDIADCQWLQILYSRGLLTGSYIPEENVNILRSYVRKRDSLIEDKSKCILQMQKELDIMNIKIHNVISDLGGVSGLNIIRAIIAGKRDPEYLLSLCSSIIQKRKAESVKKSLKGNYTEHNIFNIKSALERYEFIQGQIHSYEKQIELQLSKMTKDLPGPKDNTLPKKGRHNVPDIEGLHKMLMQLLDGNNPSQITGLTDTTVLKIISETGTDLSKWRNEKAFISWLGLSPGKEQSGRMNRRRRIKKVSKAGQIFRECAFSIAASKKSALYAFYKRIQSRSNGYIANKATARKLATYFYLVMTKGVEYIEQGLKRYENNIQEIRIKNLKKMAMKLNFTLIPSNQEPVTLVVTG
jgi:transposase